MPEYPTYRVTGDDWDPLEPEEPKSKAGASEAAAEVEGPAPDAPAEAEAPPPWTPGLPAPAPRTVVVTSGSPASPGPMSRLAGGAARVVSELRPMLRRVPPRVLAAVGGVAVVGVVGLAILLSGGSSNVAATASPGATTPGAAPTPSCAVLGAVPPAPILTVESAGSEVRQLAGIDGGAPVNLSGPWPAALGPVEAEIVLGSTLHLSAGSACIREWQAVAARPPAGVVEPWRPDPADSLQLGHQQADRVLWEPQVPLPPRGEWVVRVTVWYRQPASAPFSASGVPASAAPELVVERYFRVTIEAPGS